jgi:hypothetical protein
MNIRETFLSLTTRTYPYGTEADLFHLLPDNLQKDEFGNLFIQIGENPSVMFTSHLDTATSKLVEIIHKEENGIIRSDGTTILGADDKAGVTILLWMIEHKIKGLYYFFLGEEVGCKGSKLVAAKHKLEPIQSIKKVISFDRRGTDSVITFQSYSRCCSEKFGNALSKELNEKCSDGSFNYKNDPTGIYTDSVQFVSIYPECTNISVGYYNEHTSREQQDIIHLSKLAETCILVDWENLPVERDPKSEEYKETGYTIGGGWDWDYEQKYTKTKEIEKQKNWFFDYEFEKHISYIETNKFTKEVISIDVCRRRQLYEQTIVKKFLHGYGIQYKKYSWDGITLKIEYLPNMGGHESKMNRTEVEELLPELAYWKKMTQKKTNS